MPGWAGTASSPVNQAAHKRNKKQDKKQVEQKLCDSRRGNRDPAKTERRSYDRDHKKRQRPTQHISSSKLWSGPGREA
jgi:hypothetical protein